MKYEIEKIKSVWYVNIIDPWTQEKSSKKFKTLKAARQWVEIQSRPAAN